MKNSFRYTPITHNGVTKSLRVWARDMGIPYPAVRMRYLRGRRDFHDLFAPTPTSTPKPEPQQNRTLIDENFMPDIAKEIYAAAEELGITPMQVVVQIVTKRIEKLREAKG